MNNDNNISNLKLRRVLRYFILILAFVTIVLAILSLFKVMPIYFSMITFIIYTVLRLVREKVSIVKKGDN